MSSADLRSYFQSNVLGIALIATGVAVHTAQPYLENSLRAVVSNPVVLTLRANYYLAKGDVVCARMLAERAAQPVAKISAVKCEKI